MTEERLALVELLEKAGDGDFLRSVAEAVLQLLMQTDVEGLIGAGGIVKLGGSDKVPRSVAGSSGSKSASAYLPSRLHQGGQG
jgi:hypothetical protein